MTDKTVYEAIDLNRNRSRKVDCGQLLLHIYISIQQQPNYY